MYKRQFFNTASPDTTPPAITNVVAEPLPNGVNISWTTSEPATSRVEYGKTTNYELGVVEDTTLKTSHYAEIRGLQPSTRYHFRLKSTDEQGNTATTNDNTFDTVSYTHLDVYKRQAVPHRGNFHSRLVLM